MVQVWGIAGSPRQVGIQNWVATAEQQTQVTDVAQKLCLQGWGGVSEGV